jgi:hypothetical protein
VWWVRHPHPHHHLRPPPPPLLTAQLLGISLRSDAPLPFELCTTTWKLIMGQPAGHQDLKRSDRETAMLLERIRDNADGLDEVRPRFLPHTFPA